MKFKNVVLLITLMAAGASTAEKYGACMIYGDEKWRDECRDSVPEHECKRLFDDISKRERNRPVGYSWTPGARC